MIAAMNLGIRKGIRGRWGLFILLLVFLWPILALALSASQVFEQVKDSVVVVKSLNRQGKQVGLGSGVVLPSGEVATNHHVATAGERLQVGAHGRYVPAFLLASDPERDLALLSAPGLAATPARLGRAGGLKVGDKVFAVGAPYGLELSLSEGIVSQLRGGPPPLIQTTAPISPGSSGGGLFNDRGELVDLTTFYLKGGQGLNFALPVEFLTELAASQEPRPPARAAPVTPPGPAASGDWYDRALELIISTDWHGLLAHCRRWTQTQLDKASAYFYLGFAYYYYELGRYQEAVEALREAVRLKPDDAEAWCYLGFSYGALGRRREAVEAFRKAVRLKPDFAEAWVGLGFAYFLSGNRSAALEAVKELRRHDPHMADVLFNMIMKP